MANDDSNASMSQDIFTLGLDTETISLYLLCCGLVDIGDTLTDRSLRGVWNGSDEAIKTALDNLLTHGILGKVVSGGENQSAYRLMPKKNWH